MGWPGFQLMGTNQGGSFIHAWCIFAHTEAPTAQMNMGGALMPQRMHICFLRCVCNLHVKLANVFPDVFPEDPSWHSCLGSMSGACLGPAFKYPGPCGGHARYQTPPDQRQWTRRRCKDPVFSSTPHLNGHYADVRDFLCYVHRGHTPQNASLQCIRSIRSFRTQDLDLFIANC